MNLFRRIFLSAAVLFSLNHCIPYWEKLHSVSLQDIQKRGVLKAYMAYSQDNYFIYKDEEMGFEYELLNLFAKEIGVRLEVTPVHDLDTLPYMLNSQDGDIVASNIAVTKERQKELIFTEHLVSTRQVLVQKKKEKAAPGKYVSNAVELIGKKVHLREKSSFYFRMKDLENEIGGDIDLATVPGTVSNEELIEQVAQGTDVDYTIADEPIALINQTYYPDLDVSMPVSFPQKIAWAVRRNSPEFLKRVNQWIYKIKGDGTLQAIRKKYYKDQKTVFFDDSKEATKEEKIFEKEKKQGRKRISPYDETIRAKSSQIGWDWRLVAAVIYQESKFKPRARSWVGAAGLMQIMPGTAAAMGLAAGDIFHPEKNIQAGVKYLGYLDNYWKKVLPNAEERKKFVLASYNAGQGHVVDARSLAAYLGKNPSIWDGNAASAMLLLSNPAYFNLSVVRHGYCRGKEPYEYVNIIYRQYSAYKKITE
ncbi:MAG TPA: transporter substrate-binding domain-containing protein [Leptospiraceae bacterium]|nr:transporter substrate-binding domain-containing protein [Leptospiraceae bacterium]